MGKPGQKPYDQRAVRALDDLAKTTKLEQQWVKTTTIQEDSKGHTIESLFGPYMNDQLTVIRIDETWTSQHHQIINIVRFIECAICYCPALSVIKLRTREGEDMTRQQSALTDLATDVGQSHGITFLVEYTNEFHDRNIM